MSESNIKEEKKKEILGLLKEGDEIAQSRLAWLVNWGFYSAQCLFDELVKEGKLIKRTSGKRIYYRKKK